MALIGTGKRRSAWRRSNGHCWYCGLTLDPFNTFTLDHVVPQSQGGTNAVENLVAACKSCNSSKGQKSVAEYRTHMLRRRGQVFSLEQVAWLRSKGVSLPPPDPLLFYFETEGLA